MPLGGLGLAHTLPFLAQYGTVILFLLGLRPNNGLNLYEDPTPFITHLSSHVH